jgi:PAS domain S-box-containing protein
MNGLSEIEGEKVNVTIFHDPSYSSPAKQPKPSKKSIPNYDLVFRNLFSRAHIGLYQADASGKCVNENGGEFCSSATDAEGAESCLGFVYPDDRETTCRSWKDAMLAGAEWSGEFRYCSADGRISWLQGSIRQLRDTGGSVVGYLGCNTDVTTRAQAHDELAEMEDRYRLALEATKAGVWDLDLQSGDCCCTSYIYQMLGVEPGPWRSSLANWKELMHPEDLEAARRIEDECIEGMTPGFDLELRLRSAEGKWKWFLCKGKTASRDRFGRALRMVGTLVDISERKWVDDMLRMEHDLLDLITATSPVGILFVDREGQIRFANPRAEQILGVPREEIMRRGYQSPGWQITTHAGSPLRTGELPLRETLESGHTVVNSSFAVKRPDGERALLSMNTAPYLNAEGELGGTVVILEDVTEQKQHEQELADHDRLLRETQRIAQLGSYVLDLVDDRWSCSSKLTEILGIDETFPLNLLGHFEIVHPDFRKQFIDSYLSAVMNSSHFEMEYKVKRHNDGVERWVAECCELNHDESGKLNRMIGTVQDITERKAAEEAIRSLNDELDRRVIERTSQLAEAKKEIESFSYSVSHDLRAPLRHINSYSAILLEEHAGSLSVEGRYYLERICSASSRMGKLIDDLLTLTRVGRAEMKRESFDISKVAIEVAEMLQEADGRCRANFIIERGVRTDGDSTLVRLVLENLIGNSLKYSAQNEAPRIEFGQTLVENNMTAFFVRDDGVGFDMAYSANLFKPFQRLHGSEFEGTGIGLATVQRIVERHGGSIWAEGKEDEGATFFFTLATPSPRKEER